MNCSLRKLIRKDTHKANWKNSTLFWLSLNFTNLEKKRNGKIQLNPKAVVDLADWSRKDVKQQPSFVIQPSLETLRFSLLLVAQELLTEKRDLKSNQHDQHPHPPPPVHPQNTSVFILTHHSASSPSPTNTTVVLPTHHSAFSSSSTKTTVVILSHHSVSFSYPPPQIQSLFYSPTTRRPLPPPSPKECLLLWMWVRHRYPPRSRKVPALDEASQTQPVHRKITKCYSV